MQTLGLRNIGNQIDYSHHYDVPKTHYATQKGVDGNRVKNQGTH